MTCEQVEQQLPAYVDGAQTDRGAIENHLQTCVSCRASAHAQTIARTVLRARAAELAHAAPPGLRTRLQALAEQERASTGQARPIVPLGWSGQLSAFAAALMFVLTIGAILLPAATVR